MLRPCALAALLLMVSSRAHAGGGILPPLEVEYGAFVIGGPDHTRTVATELLVGLSWASLYPRSTPVDVTIGVLATFDPEEPAPAAARTIAPGPTASSIGGYLDLATRVEASRHIRSWFGVRGELASNDGRSVLGGAFRTSVELWTGAEASNSSSVIAGTLALALWAEVGARERSDRSVAAFTAAGIGVRLPLVIAQ